MKQYIINALCLIDIHLWEQSIGKGESSKKKPSVIQGHASQDSLAEMVVLCSLCFEHGHLFSTFYSLFSESSEITVIGSAGH